jgi:hypothetical protein
MKESGEWSKFMSKGKVYPPYLKAVADMDSFIKSKGEPYVFHYRNPFFPNLVKSIRKNSYLLRFRLPRKIQGLTGQTNNQAGQRPSVLPSY